LRAFSLPGDDHKSIKPNLQANLRPIIIVILDQAESVRNENLRANLRAPSIIFVLLRGTVGIRLHLCSLTFGVFFCSCLASCSAISCS
jgi:hypothetical protein